MKVLVIPDVHLKPWMFERAAELMKGEKAEQAVCLMDIPDDWGQESNLGLYEETFDKAIWFQNCFPQTLWCYGNHDLSYVWDQYESGFSAYAMLTVLQKLREFQAALPSQEQLAYIHRIDDVLFLHGGLTHPFVNFYASDLDYDDTDEILRRINSLGRKDIWDDASPIWHRPQYYHERMYRAKELLQVVGHTPARVFDRFDNVLSCDVFSTTRSGHPIGSQKFLLIDTKTWEYEGV